MVPHSSFYSDIDSGVIFDKSFRFTRMGNDPAKDHGFILHSFNRDEWMNEVTSHQTVNIIINLYLKGADGPLRKDNADQRLARRIKSLEVGKLADFRIEADDGLSFPVHSVLLASTSDVFAAMFSTPGTLEQDSGQLILDDFSSDAVQVASYGAVATIDTKC